jgi:alpha-galactosidase
MTKKIEIAHVEQDFQIGELDNSIWKNAGETVVENYWSGESAPKSRHFKTKLLWSDAAFYIRFEANQREPLVASENPNLKSKTHGLWNRDVCEIFVAPDANEPNKYFEFEVAPNGEWIDLAIHQLPKKRETDFEYDSEMQSAARIETNKITMAIKISWNAFGRTPKVEDVWRGNLYRCVGRGATRGYLAWSPTETKEPNFHVPARFGEFQFVK